jgi:hypothetical protein
MMGRQGAGGTIINIGSANYFFGVHACLPLLFLFSRSYCTIWIF